MIQKKKKRIDYDAFVKLTTSHNIPLLTVDSKSELSKLDNFCSAIEYDFLISISWRYLISPNVFMKSNIGSINIHRGDLPKYAGIEPIRRALENNENEIAICSHNITENYDEGKVLCKEIGRAHV